MEVVDAVEGDVDSWMEVVREVEALFGPMPDFKIPLRRGIARGTALCVRDARGNVADAPGLLSRSGASADINWLAVRSSGRRRGVARMLLTEALRRLPADADITVDTFGEDNLEGRGARRLYESFGFVPGEVLERGPEGGTRQRFRLVRQSAHR